LAKQIVGVKFRPEGKIYTFGAGDLPLQKNDQVVINTDQGLSIGKVATELSTVEVDQLPVNLKYIIRKATEDDLRIREENQCLEKEARQYCRERIIARALPMKLITLECAFDKSKMVFYFTAENRVDFRELVRDLVQKFKARIELRQIGARQETKLVKGLGMCGREVCCASSLPNIDRVSIKMAKEQSLSLNPEKISGLCGRLMCCLAFEYEGYVEMRKGMPKCGKTVHTAQGNAKVLRQNVLRGEIAVALENGKEITLNIKDLESGGR
jgi:cell fate regulator YaaT (PSP1 superfamily)